MNRRELLGVGVGVAAFLSRPAAAQPVAARRLGILAGAPNAAVAAKLGQIPAFLDQLHRLGWTAGSNLTIDTRYAGNKPELFTAGARELVALKPDVIFGVLELGLKALLAETRTIPIVFALTSYPVTAGFVASLAHPGGNVTGFVPLEASVAGKYVEILREISPGTTRVLFVIEPQEGQQRMRDAAAGAAKTLGLSFAAATVSSFSDIERAIGAFAQQPGGGLILTASNTAFPQRQRLNALLLQHRMPAVFSFPNFARSGGLVSYSSNRVAQFRQAAGYVDRILRGEKPGDLPVQQPTNYLLIVNLKTAKALGLAVPQSLLARADEVIE